MSSSQEEQHHRRRMRLQGYDYGQAGAYFVTICTRERVSLFGHVEAGVMKLNSLGRIVQDEWARTPAIRENVALDEFIVMPNHLHAILVFLEDLPADMPPLGTARGLHQRIPDAIYSGRPFRSPSRNLGSVVRGIKGASTKRIRDLLHDPAIAVWQRNYYEHVVRNEEEMNQIREYIANNALRWSEDRYYPGEQQSTIT